jgi:hypothetical protein
MREEVMFDVVVFLLMCAVSFKLSLFAISSGDPILSRAIPAILAFVLSLTLVALVLRGRRHRRY